jgi:hypothetical protein
MQQQPHLKFQQPPCPAAQPMQNTSAQGNPGISKCFECGMMSHFAKKCPNKQSVSAIGTQSRPQAQQNYMYNKVNHVTSEEAQQAQDVILGMFLASSHPATILFDSGASHSFISSSFAAKYNLPIATMKHTMLVSSPGGEISTKHICPTVSISIKGVDFPSNAILLDSKDIDIILGMDWLRKYDRVIQCAKRIVRLTKEDGTTIEFVATKQSNQASTVNQAKVTALEEIRVVQEYPNVFPEDLPGMPPDHDIEFIIELLPGTPPISKRPYRMPVNELIEFKKQIAEL